MTAQTELALGQSAIDDAKPAADDLRLWSVTTIIGALDKPALLYWAAEQSSIAAVRDQKVWQAMVDSCPDSCDHSKASDCEAVKYLRDARFRRPKGIRTAAELGTDVHAACEEYALTGTRPDVDDEVRPFLDQFDQWLQKFSPTFEATEVTVYNPTFGYAGTLDAIMVVDGVRFIVDYKTSREHLDSRGNLRTPYPEQVALQLAAYRHAEQAAAWRPRRFEKWRRRYYLLSPEEQGMALPVPEVDTGLVLQITPQTCHGYPMECGPQVFDAFLFTLECFRWLQEDSKQAMGDALEAGA